MSTDVKHVGSAFAREQELKLKRMDDLRPADSAARRAVIRRNRGIAFTPRNKSSHVFVENGRVEVGSTKPSYFKLMNLDGEQLAYIYTAWIVTGSTRG